VIGRYELRHMIYRGSTIVPTFTLISILSKFFFFFYKVGPFLGVVFPEMFGVPRVR
jgi:hypothetical protein